MLETIFKRIFPGKITEEENHCNKHTSDQS